MDNLTHTLFAITLGRTPIGRAGGGTTVALVLASNMPDIDIVAAAQSATEYLHWHRGPTHGPLAIVGLGIPAAGLAWLWNQFRERRIGGPLRPAATFTRLSLAAMLGVLLHLAMDFPTSYGTRLLSPFDWTWYALDWMPIIDIYLLVALGAGLVLAGRAPEKRRQAATVVLALMGANYAIRGVAHHQALSFGRVLGSNSDPCSPRDDAPFLPERWPSAVRAAETGCTVSVAALPTFGSPVAWTLVTQRSNGYELRDLNIMDRPDPNAPRTRRYFPNEWTPAVRRASESRLGQIYLGFSRFPAARSSVDPDGSTVVRWNDMRFVTGIRRAEQGTERSAFSALVRLDPSGRVIEERFGP